MAQSAPTTGAVRSREEKETIAQRFMKGNFIFNPQVHEELKSPNFDFWHYESDSAELLALQEVMYTDLGLLEAFSIPKKVLRRFLLRVFVEYNDNPYHNFNHCFCVTQMMYAMIVGFKDSWLTDLEKLVLLTSATCHDLDHPGTNNAYQRKARTWFAETFADSYLERHHLQKAHDLLADPESDIFGPLSSEQREQAFELLGKLIIATDMALHQQFVSSFKGILNSGKYDFNDKDHRDLVMQLMLKSCDISNEARPLGFTDKWASCLLDEFFHQGDLEKEQGLPVDTLMDRTKVEKNASQVGFIQFVSLPLFQELGQVVPLAPMLENLKNNLRHYKREKERLESAQQDS